MKKRNMLKTVGALGILTLITTCLIGGTLAKYTEKVSASDTARVAVFDVESNLNEASFNLFDTASDYVWSNKGDKTIAPGTNGEFELQIKNGSEVKVGYEVDLQVINEGEIPILFSVDEGDWYDNINDLSDIAGILSDDGDEETIKIYWKWIFENDNDEWDTELGKAGTATVNVTASATFTQIAE